MFTLIGWREDIDPAGIDVNIAALADQHVTVALDDIRVPGFANKIVAAVGLIDDTVAPDARIESPTLRQRSNLYIAPLNGQAGVAQLMNNPHNVADMRSVPVEVAVGENLSIMINSNPAAVQDQTVLVWLADGAIEPIKGDMFTVQAASAVAAVANVWTNVAIAFAEDLPRGRYQIVGLRGESVSMNACRLVLVGSPNRPGVPGCLLVDDLASDIFRHGNFGVFGEFEDTDAPTIDVLCNLADAAQVFYLDLIRVREGAGS